MCSLFDDLQVKFKGEIAENCDYFLLSVDTFVKNIDGTSLVDKHFLFVSGQFEYPFDRHKSLVVY